MSKEQKYFDEAGKYLSGESSSVPEKSDSFQELENIWNLSKHYQYEETNSSHEAWNNLVFTINQQENASKPKLTWIKNIKWAAAAVVLFALGLSIYFINQNKNQTTEIISVAVENGKTKLHTLPDGSTINLRGGSKISYSSDFGDKNRNIELSGEGQFEIAKNPNLPFIVSTQNSKTQVLGTGFDLKAYPNETVKISVSHGKVAFSSVLEKMELTVGESAEVNVLTKKLTKIATESNINSWQQGRMVFENATLTDVAKEFLRVYGKTLSFDPNSANRKYYGKIDIQQGAEANANIIAETLKISIQVK